MHEFLLYFLSEERRLYAKLHHMQELDDLPEDFEVKIPTFLRQNPRLVRDLVKEHKKSPRSLNILIIPNAQLILAHTGNQIQATYAQLLCTRSAIDRLFGLYTPADRHALQSGYYIFNTSFTFPHALISYVQTQSTRDPSFDFNYHENDPLRYIAADIQGFLSINQQGDLSARMHLPLPPPQQNSFFRKNRRS